MEKGQDNWKRLEIFICDITEGGQSVMYEVKVHALVLIKRTLVRCESSFRNNSGGKKIWV